MHLYYEKHNVVVVVLASKALSSSAPLKMKIDLLFGKNTRLNLA